MGTFDNVSVMLPVLQFQQKLSFNEAPCCLARELDLNRDRGDVVTKRVSSSVCHVAEIHISAAGPLG